MLALEKSPMDWESNGRVAGGVREGFFFRGSFVFVCVNNVSRFFRETFLGVLSGLFRGLLVTSIWVIKRSLGRSWLVFLILLVFV